MSRRTPRVFIATTLALALTLAFGTASALAQSPPVVTLTGSSEVGVTSAKLEGEVNPEGEPGSPETFFHFEVSADNGSGEPDGNWIFVNGNPDGVIESAEAEAASPVAVEGIAEGLQPATTYFIRLAADNAEFANHAETTAPFPSFETAEATVPGLAPKTTTPVSYSSATLHGTVNPHGGNVNPIGGPIPINWQFEYREVGQEGWNGTGLTEISGADAESTKALPVSVELGPGSLTSNKTYEVRVFAYYLFSRETVSPSIPPTETFTTQAATAPTLEINDATSITGTSAKVTGKVTPTEGEADPAFTASCEFDYVTDAQFNATKEGGFTQAQHAGCQPNPVEGTGATPVEAETFELQPHTKYRLRLRAENQGGKTTLEGSPFTTEAVAPTITSTFVESVGDDGATLNAKIIPGGAPTTYHFLYLTLVQFEANGETFTGATSTPESASIGEDNAEHIASAPIGDLEPDTAYRYRVIATNSKGTIEGDVHTLHTYPLPSEEPNTCPNADKPGSGFLPNCRAYEMVSPPDKRGGDVIAMTERTHMATDGNAASFASLVPFGDARGIGVATEYMSLRDGTPATNGWATHAITPPQDALSVKKVALFDPLYISDLSDDLDLGVFRTLTPLTDDPNVAEVFKLYLRDDLRTPGVGSYQLLTPCPVCDLSGTPLPPPDDNDPLQPLFVGASDDFQHAVFQQRVNLTTDAAAQAPGCAPASTLPCLPRAYESSEGQLHLIGLVPTGSATSCGGSGPACVVAEASVPGGGVGTPPVPNRPLNVISADGSRTFFTVPTNESGNVTNGKQPSGKLYMRTAATTTDQLNASERTDCAGDPECGGDNEPDPAPLPFKPANYLTSSVDGSRVFFLTSQAISDDAPNDGQPKMYIYDATKPPTDPHNLTFISPASGLVDASQDGSYVYFLSGQEVELWHQGAITDVAGPVVAAETGNTGQNAINLTHARVTPDGHHLLLPLHDTGSRQLYLYSADTHELACASCPTDGTTPSGDAAVGLRENKGAASPTRHLNRALSADGRYVFFTSPDPLVPADTNGKKDAYTYDAQTDQVHLLSSGTSKSDSYFLEADPDGSNVLFVTNQQLLGWDNDSSYDLYDARIEGGFPEPEAEPDHCSGDSCRQIAQTPPNLPGTASNAFAGPGSRPGGRPSCPRASTR